jgi:hypothetical protein
MELEKRSNIAEVKLKCLDIFSRYIGGCWSGLTLNDVDIQILT